MHEFINFLKTGKATKSKNYFHDFVVLFVIIYALNFSLLIAKGFYFGENIIDPEDFNTLSWGIFFSLVILVPIIEELTFRAPLLFHKKKILLFAMFPAIIFFSTSFIKNNIAQNSILILFFAFGLFYLLSAKFKNTANNFITKNYLILVYFTSISFGLIHMDNYETIDFKAFISVFNRILGGFYFAFLITKYKNIGASILMHCVNNSTLFIILLLAKIWG